MHNNPNKDFAELTSRYQALLQSQQTLILSTASEIGEPDISYAPFVRDQFGSFYIYVSELANHTRNLLNNPKAAVLFIRSENSSPNLFARERAIINCIATIIPRDNDSYSEQLQALQIKFGEVINLLSSLNDFHLFSLSPQNGRYIVGFGQAYRVDPTNDSII